MKKKITILTLFFIMIFSTSVFAKQLNSIDNVDPHKTWTIKFNKDINIADISIKDKNNQDISFVTDVDGEKVMLRTFFDYYPSEYTLKVKSAKAIDGTSLKEPCEMKFTVTKQPQIKH